MILKLYETYSSETIFPKSQSLWAGAYENRIDQPGQMQWSQFSVKILGFLDDWKKFIEALLPEKEDFYSHLNIEDIDDSDYTHTKIVCKYFKIRNLRYYHELYVQSNKLLVADIC